MTKGKSLIVRSIIITVFLFILSNVCFSSRFITHVHDAELYYMIVERDDDEKKIKDYLIKHPKEINLIDPFFMDTPLHYAARKNMDGIVKYLLSKGAKVNVSDYYGRTALVYAAEEGNAKICKMLLAAGSDPNVRSHLGKTPIFYAIDAGNVETVKILIKNGADVRIRDFEDKYPIDSAFCHQNREMIKLIIAAGADLNLDNIEWLHKSLDQKSFLFTIGASPWFFKRVTLPFFLFVIAIVIFVNRKKIRLSKGEK